MAGYRMLGRFLAVGVPAGGVIGGFVGGLAAWSPSPDHAVGGLSVGAALGIVLGLLTQAVTFALVLAARAVRPSLTRTTNLVVGAGVPLAAVAYHSSWVAGMAHHDAGKSVVLVGGAMALAAGTVLLSLRWCVSPPTGTVPRQARESS